MNVHDEVGQSESSVIGDLLEGLRTLEAELSARAALLMPSTDLLVVEQSRFLHWPDSNTYAAYRLLEPSMWERYSPAGIGGAPVIVAVVATSLDDLEKELRELAVRAEVLSARVKGLHGEQLACHRATAA